MSVFVEIILNLFFTFSEFLKFLILQRNKIQYLGMKQKEIYGKNIGQNDSGGTITT